MSLSDISDLTDISSDEDDVPLAKRNTKAKKSPKEYKIANVPPCTPDSAIYSQVTLWYDGLQCSSQKFIPSTDQIIENAIDLDPEYQRDVVWQEEKQSGLIDSLLRNYYIPPIIFAVTIQDDGSELRTCIDGKQRLTSIQRFTNEKLWFKSSATNTKRKLLPQYLRTQFTNKQIVCIEYTELNNDQEREIFQRVQLGVALTPAERLQAIAGPWSTTIREIQNHALGEEGFQGYLDWGHARGRDFQCLATIGYLIENHPKTTVPGTKALEKWLQRTEPVPARLRADLHETFRIFVTLARDKKYSGSLNRPTRVSPIEFVMIGVLIYLKRQTLSLTQISSAVEKMRKDVRASHTDIRSNTRVTKHLTEFMAKKIKVSELKSDGEGNKPAAQVVAKAAKPAKRKRPIYSDDSDSDHLDRISKVKPSNYSTESTDPAPVEACQVKLVRKGQGLHPLPQTSVTPKPSQPSGSSRKTNNSMSGILPAPAEKPPLLTPATKTTWHGLPPLSLPSTSNGHNSHTISKSESTHIPLAVQTGPTIKAESPQISSLNSLAPTRMSVADRLAPIRAAKASLVSGIGAAVSFCEQRWRISGNA
ncbi:hypothetical protein JVU11DRAFT_7128 [Chiua virens]|nr:hypothetical protein JVU11DRAFT_7128 [Chiua virens]